MGTSSFDRPLNPPSRVALVAVHGVADQKEGVTARQIAGLMVHTGGEVSYSAAKCDTVMIAVPPLKSSRHVQGKNNTLDLSVSGDNGPQLKQAWRESVSSDFEREDWGAPQGPDSNEWKEPADMGVAFSDYLLFKSEGDNSDRDAYETSRIRMSRIGTSGTYQKVDIYEMYWADLSRLSGNFPRIISELFTMVFRLSRLGRDAVGHATKAAGREARLEAVNGGEARGQDQSGPGDKQRSYMDWKGHRALQHALDWSFACVLSNLFLQLLLAGTVIAVLGVAGQDRLLDLGRTSLLLAWLLPVLPALLWCYLHSDRPAGWIFGLSAAAGVALLLAQIPPIWLIGISWLGFISMLCNFGLRLADGRFPGVRVVGLWFLGVSMSVLIARFAWELQLRPEDGLCSWVIAALFVAEILLVLIIGWWVVLPLLLFPWLLQAAFLGKTAAGRATVATGLLGLFVSLASFVAMFMALWALLSNVLELGAENILYRPVHFDLNSPTGRVDGKAFLQARYSNSTAGFSIVAFPILILLLYVLISIVPSVFAEIKLRFDRAEQLGRWLSLGFSHLDSVVRILVLLSVAAAVYFGGLLGLGLAGPDIWLDRQWALVSQLSQLALNPLLAAAGAATFITLFSTLLSRYVPWLRLPLDIALDVDNNFREFPRNAIPRARIFARYVALLEHLVSEEKYERIVIVAHSQGSVITADLLRYLAYRGAHPPGGNSQDRMAALWHALDGKVELLTAGSPLRQLYASRFPYLYGWVTADISGMKNHLTPKIKVNNWVNIYAAGDYVGRWLCDPVPSPRYGSGNPVMSPDGLVHDVCIGEGAHTHYFDQDKSLVAQQIDLLIGYRKV